VQEQFEDRQTGTAEALAELLREIQKNEQRKQEQAAKGLNGLMYFVLCKHVVSDQLKPASNNRN
jgi:type I restriction enzyme, R subunit